MRWVNLPTLTSPTQTGLTPIGERAICLKRLQFPISEFPTNWSYNWTTFRYLSLFFRDIVVSLNFFFPIFFWRWTASPAAIQSVAFAISVPCIRPFLRNCTESWRWKISTVPADWPSRSVESSVELQEYSLAKSSKSTRMPSRKTTGLYSPHTPPKKRSHPKDRRMTKFDLFKSCLFLINFLHKISAKNHTSLPCRETAGHKKTSNIQAKGPLLKCNTAFLVSCCTFLWWNFLGTSSNELK